MPTDYIPSNDGAFAIWYANFAAKFAQYAAMFGFTPADITAVNNDLAMITYCLNAAEAYKAASKDRVNYKKIVFDKPVGTPAPPVPVAPAIAPPANIPPPGIVARARALAARIKASPAYKENIGKELGIVGASTSQNDLPIVGIKPIITAQVSGEAILVGFVKNGYEGILLQTQRGAETEWVQIANLRYSPYRDERANLVPNVAEVRRYRGMYIKRDVGVGDFSDVVSVTVV